MTKKAKIILIAVLGTILSILVFIIGINSSWSILDIGYIMSEDPPQPEQKYGEFPFTLIYEINGERVEIQDTLVIEHLGVDFDEGRGKHNTWKTYYKNDRRSGETLVIFSEFVENIGTVTISFKLGSCEYYMGLVETEYAYKYKLFQPGDIVITSPEGTRTIAETELYNSYNIKIIEKSISPPI